MALYEYFCTPCRFKFEQITSSTDPDAGKCPKCLGKETKKLISLFRVAGRGDLRESTMHGCHGCHSGHDHSHSQPSSSESASEPGDSADSGSSGDSNSGSASGDGNQPA